MNSEIIKQLHQWYQKQPGKSLLLKEKQLVSRQLARMRGEQIIFMGDWLLPEKDHKLDFQQQIVVSPHVLKSNKNLLRAAFAELPLAENSVDVVVMPHVLDFCHRPGDVLKEAYRILTPEGYLVLLTFNPFSLWNLCRYLRGKKARQRIPWLEPYLYYSANTLAEFKFLLIERQTYYFFPPFKSEKILNKIGFLEDFGMFCMPALGNSVLTLAQKRVNLAQVLIIEEETKIDVVPNV